MCCNGGQSICVIPALVAFVVWIRHHNGTLSVGPGPLPATPNSSVGFVGLAVDPWKGRWRITAVLVLIGNASLGFRAVDVLTVSMG